MLGFIVSAVGFVLALIQFSLSIHFQGYFNKRLCLSASYSDWDTCEDWPTDNAEDSQDYMDARKFSSEAKLSSSVASAISSATLTAITLFALFMTHAFIKFGILSKHLNNTVVVALTKTAFVFSFTNFLTSCSIISWNGTFSDETSDLDEDDRLETGSIANAWLAFNVINFVFIVAVDVLNMLGKTEAKGKNVS